MSIRPSASDLPRVDDKLFTAIAATNDPGLGEDTALALLLDGKRRAEAALAAADGGSPATASDDDYAQRALAQLTAMQTDDEASTARTEAQAKQAEEDMKALVERKRKQRGRRRADAMLAVLRSMADEGRAIEDITGHDADVAWAVADLLHSIAGELNGSTRDSLPAKGSAPAARVLDARVEGGIGAGSGSSS